MLKNDIPYGMILFPVWNDVEEFIPDHDMEVMDGWDSPEDALHLLTAEQGSARLIGVLDAFLEDLKRHNTYMVKHCQMSS